MLELFINLSITGGTAVLLWALTYPLSKKYFKASWHYAVLKITMVFMIIPISLFTPALTEILKKPDLSAIPAEELRWNWSVSTSQNEEIMVKTERIINYGELDGLIRPDAYMLFPEFNGRILAISRHIKTKAPHLWILWLSVAIIMFSRGIYKMKAFKKRILKNALPPCGEDIELFLQCKKRLGIRGDITLLSSGYIKTPLVFGLIKRFVIFPETGMSADEKRIAFIHELSHIKNRDLPVKLLSFLISCVHWFNPLSHLLRRRIAAISEERCDESVVRAIDESERALYGNLILKVASDISAYQPKIYSALSAPAKNMKRRLFNIINPKKFRLGRAVFSLAAALVICFCASVCAFASSVSPEKPGYDLVVISENNASEYFDFLPAEYYISEESAPDGMENAIFEVLSDCSANYMLKGSANMNIGFGLPLGRFEDLVSERRRPAQFPVWVFISGKNYEWTITVYN